MKFFKGFVKTKNKKCIEKFKNRTDFKSYEEVSSLPEFAGILADDTVLIDVDDEPQSELLLNIVDDLQLNCRVYKSRSGMHFLFKNDGRFDKCKTKCKIAVGLENIDIKVGSSNSYEVLKIDGQEREVMYDIESDEEYQIAPKFFLPVNSRTDFNDLHQGDGRNQALFNYILTLQSNDFEVEEARDCIRLMNKYVLKEPLDDEELEVILRDEAFAQPVFFKGTTFLFDKFAVFLKNNHHIIRINNQLHLYKDGIYVSGQAEIEAVMIQHLPQLNRTKRQEVLSYLDLLVREDTPQSPASMIAFKNGIYDINTDELKEFSPDYVITNKIPWDFNANAYYEATDNVLNNITCHDADLRMLLEEMIGYCFYRRNELGKAFILTGSGSNGKSTFLNMIKKLLGKRNTSALDLKKLGDRFSTVMLFGKLANIGDDISNEFLCDTAEFKKITTGETIDAEQKGQPKFDFEAYCKLIFCANSIPRMGKGSDSAAIMRRLVIVPFNARFSADDPDYKPYIGDELKGQQSMEYLIQLGIAGLKRVLQNRKFTESDKIRKELEEYEEENNPILRFTKECQSDDYEINGQATSKVYDKYKEFCIVENLQPVSKIAFSKHLTKHFGYTIVDRKIDKKKFRLFVKEG